MYIIGISAFYHDSAAVILKDDEIVAAAQEERFTRKKNDDSFPLNSIKYCLDEAGISIHEVSTIVFYDKPFIKFERLLETYYAFAPKGRKSFCKSMPVWVKEKLFIKKIIFDSLKEIEDFDKAKLALLFSSHHLSHAASAFYPSPFEEAAILTIDAVGEWATASIGYGSQNGIKIIKELNFPHSVGLFYSAFTYFLGFKVNSGEYKLMGLAPFGEKNSKKVDEYLKLIKSHLVDIKADGSIFLNQKFFNYTTGLTMINEKKWEKLFGLKRRMPEEDIDQCHSDLAFAAQSVTEEIVLLMAGEVKKITGSKNLCLAGGVALNCVANSKILKEKLFDKISIQPAAGDAGGALGAALAVYYIYQGNSRKTLVNKDSMKGAYLGPQYKEKEIKKYIKKFNPQFEEFADYEILSKKVASLLSSGKIVGWFQGKMEWGPRALGNRSILADPRRLDMQKILNLKIKYREGFRPFAPAVLEEKREHFFELETISPYMLLVCDVKKDIRKNTTLDLKGRSMFEKLYLDRSSLPAITHLDYTARVQTVSQQTNYRFWKLLSDFFSETNCPVLINTSFNVRGEPIVCTPLDAYVCFMNTDMDYLVMGNIFFDKKQQPPFDKCKYLRRKVELD